MKAFTVAVLPWGIGVGEGHLVLHALLEVLPCLSTPLEFPIVFLQIGIIETRRSQVFFITPLFIRLIIFIWGLAILFLLTWLLNGHFKGYFPSYLNN